MSSRKKPSSEAPTTPTYPTLDRDLTFTAKIELMDTTLMGLRRVQSMGCILSVVAAPYSQLHRLKAALSTTGYLCYVIHGSVVYVGHGNDDRHFGERLSRAIRNRSHIYVLYASDPRFDKPAAAYLEARFIDRLHEIGVPLENQNRPFGSGLAIDTGMEQLLRQAEALLGLAGFRPLKAVGNDSRRSIRSLSTTRLAEGVEPIESDEMPSRPPNSNVYRLDFQGMHAEGFFMGKSFYVEPGAEYALELRRGMSRHNKRRRKAIEKYLQPIPEIDDRKRLRVGLKCATMPIAAKILTGMHIGTKAWKVVQ